MPVAQDRVEELQIKKLLHCVRTEDYLQIKKLCDKGVELLINYNEPIDGETALILAASMNNDKMLQYLLDLGAHPNVVDFKGRSALMRAAEMGHVQVIEILKKANADAKIRDVEGRGMN
jgi:ankyrin repeat protein